MQTSLPLLTYSEKDWRIWKTLGFLWDLLLQQTTWWLLRKSIWGWLWPPQSCAHTPSHVCTYTPAHTHTHSPVLKYLHTETQVELQLTCSSDDRSLAMSKDISQNWFHSFSSYGSPWEQKFRNDYLNSKGCSNQYLSITSGFLLLPTLVKKSFIFSHFFILWQYILNMTFKRLSHKQLKQPGFSKL